MSKSKLMKMLPFIALVMGLFAVDAAFAAGGGGTTGTEFQTLYTWMRDIVTGYGGRAMAFAFLIGGVIMGAARQSPILAIGGVVAAIFMFYLPTVIDGIFTAVI